MRHILNIYVLVVNTVARESSSALIFVAIILIESVHIVLYWLYNYIYITFKTFLNNTCLVPGILNTIKIIFCFLI